VFQAPSFLFWRWARNHTLAFEGRSTNPFTTLCACRVPLRHLYVVKTFVQKWEVGEMV